MRVNASSVSRFLYGLNGKAQTHRAQNGGQGADLWVALFGEGTVQGAAVQLRLFGNFTYATKGFAHLAQGNQQFARLASIHTPWQCWPVACIDKLQ